MLSRNKQRESGWVLRLIRDESGPTATEYGVMLSLIIIGVLVTIVSIGDKMNTTFTSIADAIDTA